MAPVRSMRLAPVALLAAATFTLAVPTAGAETVMVHRRTRVMSRPTEDADTIMRIKADRPAKVLRRGGGWVKVRIGEQVGWIPRSQIEEDPLASEEEEEEEELEGDEEEVAADDELEGEDEDEEADVEQESDDDEELPGGEAPDEDARPKPPRFAASAGLGLRNLTYVFSSDGAMELGNYRLSARAFSAGVALDVTAYRAGQLIVVVDGRYQGSVATPGVQFTTSDQATGYVPFTTHDIDVGARGGYSFGWLRANGRLGYHADIIQVTKLENVGKMPSESLTGYTIGGALEIPFTGKGWNARIGGDLLVSGKRKQTKGLEDGAPAGVSASWFGLAVGYALSARLAAEIGYRRARTTSSWTGTSAREADITSARRTDVGQQLTLGLTQTF